MKWRLLPFLIFFGLACSVAGFILGLGSDPGPALQPEPTSAITTSTHQLRDGTTVECITWYADASNEESAERECFITGQLPTLPE